MQVVEDRLIRVPEAARKLGVCVRKVWEMLSQGIFRRVKHPTMPRVTCLLLSEVDAYIQRLAENSRASV